MVDDINKEAKLIDLLEDSVTFITFIVEIESYFDIEVPDKYLMPENLTTLEDLIYMIEKLSN